MATHTNSDTPNFCKVSSPDYDPARCAKHHERKRHRRNDQRESLKAQSIVFDRTKFTAATARKWLADHGFKSGKIDTKENELRFRQRDPGRFTIFRRKSLGQGVSAVLAR